MSPELAQVLSSLFGGLCVAIPTVMTTISSNKKSNILTNYKIEQLTKEVKEHNNFARRMPVVEEEIKSLTSRVNKIEDRK